VAVNAVDFEVEKGQIVAFSARTAPGRRPPCGYSPVSCRRRKGTASVAGFDVLKQPMEVKKRIGYLPESPPVYPEMEVEEYLTFVARLKGCRRQ